MIKSVNSLLCQTITSGSFVYGTKIRHFAVTTKYFRKKVRKKLKLTVKVKAQCEYSR